MKRKIHKTKKTPTPQTKKKRKNRTKRNQKKYDEIFFLQLSISPSIFFSMFIEATFSLKSFISVSIFFSMFMDATFSLKSFISLSMSMSMTMDDATLRRMSFKSYIVSKLCGVNMTLLRNCVTL